MSAIRRTNGPSSNTPTTPSNTTTTANMPSTDPPATHSPYRPTSTEAIFLSIYPLTLFFGSLFSHLSPTLRPPFNNSTYSVDAQSFQPASAAPSYFAQKRNVFNVYFVKYGWFWCTFAFLIFTALSSRGRAARAGSKKNSPQEEKNVSDERLRRRYQALIRWAIATTFWILVTQWCFGPPLIDRGFALSGGACDLAAHNVDHPEDTSSAKEEVASILTHAACTVAKGTWRGGYDISGHVFILVLGSGMLWMEMVPYVFRQFHGFHVGRVIRRHDGRLCRVGSPETARDVAAFPLHTPAAVRSIADAVKNELHHSAPSMSRAIRGYATTLSLAVAVLSWWMLLMTAAFFHTWFEKLTGCAVAFLALWVIYFVPRGVPWVRGIEGMPGL